VGLDFGHDEFSSALQTVLDPGITAQQNCVQYTNDCCQFQYISGANIVGALDRFNSLLTQQATLGNNTTNGYTTIESAITSFESAYQAQFGSIQSGDVQSWGEQFTDNLNDHIQDFGTDAWTDLTKFVIDPESFTEGSTYELNTDAIDTSASSDGGAVDSTGIGAGDVADMVERLNFVVTAVQDVSDMDAAYQAEYDRNPYLPTSTREKRASAAEDIVGGVAVETTAASTVATEAMGDSFVEAGAVIGTAIEPGGGTIIGAAIGGLAAGIAGAVSGAAVGTITDDSLDADDNGDGISNREQMIDDETDTTSAPDMNQGD
jgi:hypothetical protein